MADIKNAFRPYVEPSKGRKLMAISVTDMLAAEARLARLDKKNHWCGYNIWENDDLSALVLLTSTKCRICFVIFRYDDGSYDLVGNPGQVLARADHIGTLLSLVEDIVIY